VDFFYSKFPEYLHNDFFITGESYGGIYIPRLAQKILVHNVETNHPINLKGFMIGNGCTKGDECTRDAALPKGYSKYEFEQFNDHAFVSPSDWQEFEEKCYSEDEVDEFASHKCKEV